MSFHFSTFYNHKTTNSGFGLIELLVSISIIVIVVSIILIRQESFNGAVLLRSQAYEVALQIREVQLTAVSVVFDEDDFRSRLGVHMYEGAPNNQRFRIFRDANDNGFYNANEEFGQQGILDERFEIKDIRVVGDSYSAPSGLSIVFQRPNFDAQFYDANGRLSAASIEIDIGRKGESGGVVRTVEVTASGQISVQ